MARPGSVQPRPVVIVDELVELVIIAPDRKTLVTRTRALDRVLLWSYYAVPHWYTPVLRVAYWDKFRRPGVLPKYRIDINTWWIDAAKEATLAAKKK